jgi:DNA primase
MARVPEGEIERLKSQVSVQRLAEARGVELKRHGADLIGLCPFHDDKKPSLVISSRKNLWHCLGACQAGGSVIDWVMKAEGVSFRHAVELLRADLPLTSPSTNVVKTSWCGSWRRRCRRMRTTGNSWRRWWATTTRR